MTTTNRFADIADRVDEIRRHLTEVRGDIAFMLADVAESAAGRRSIHPRWSAPAAGERSSERGGAAGLAPTVPRMIVGRIELGTLGEWAAAITGSVALIFAFLGWKTASQATKAQTEFIAAELERHALERSDREAQAQISASLVEFEERPTNLQPDGSMRINADHQAIRFHNGSGQPLRWMYLELIFAGGEVDRNWMEPVPRDHRYLHHLPPDYDEWRVEFGDLGGRTWGCDRQDPLPRPIPDSPAPSVISEDAP